jgi:hypothetical protein
MSNLLSTTNTTNGTYAAMSATNSKNNLWAGVVLQ